MADPAKVSAAATIDWDEESTHWLAVQVVAETPCLGSPTAVGNPRQVSSKLLIVEGTVGIEDCETSL